MWYDTTATKKEEVEKWGHKVEFPVSLFCYFLFFLFWRLVFEWVKRMYVTQEGLRKCVAYAAVLPPADWTQDEYLYLACFLRSPISS